jgi:serine/threonine protein kinase
MTDPVARLSRALEGRYRFEREIGAGGMATVYLARDVRYDRDVAVKVLKPDIAAAVGTERFLREIRITAQLNHPHILPLLDSGRVDGSADERLLDGGDAVIAQPPNRPTADFLYYVMPYAGRCASGCAVRSRSISRQRCGLPTRWRPRSTTRTAAASCIAT